MAQRTPEFALPDDTTVLQFLERTAGAVFWDDDEELLKIPLVDRSVRVIAKCADIGDLRNITMKEVRDAVRQAVGAQAVEAWLRLIMKYLGTRGSPHIPPGE